MNLTLKVTQGDSDKDGLVVRVNGDYSEKVSEKVKKCFGF